MKKRKSTKRYGERAFYKALVGYGELEHDDLMELTDGNPLIIDGREVDTILDDGGLKYSYIKDGVAYSTRLYIDDIPKPVRDRIYEFLCDNYNYNNDFFNSLS